jgi:hypothetical protein
MVKQRHQWDPVCPSPPRLVRPVRLDPAGAVGPTRGQARGTKWRRTSQGFYVPSWVDGTLPEQRIMEQSVRLPEGGAVTGWASCRLGSANFFDGRLPDGVTLMPVPLSVGAAGDIRADAAVSVSCDRLEPDEMVVRHGIACARDRRALFDAMRTTDDVRESVVAMDMMAAAERVSIERMREYLGSRRGWKGVPVARAALDLASEYSRSPNETRMRLVWLLDAGLPSPRVNQSIFDLRGRLLGIADLLDPVAGVVGEYDGADHRSAHRQSKDVGREELFRRYGLEVFRVTGPDMPFRQRIVSRMRATRERAKWLPPERCQWTITAPVGWAVEPSLDEVLDQRDWMAEVQFHT